MKSTAAQARKQSAGGRWSPAVVKQLRKRHQLSQTALARMVGVGLNTIYLWEKGLTSPRAGVRARVLQLTKCSAAELKARLRKVGLTVGMKKPGRKPKAAGKARPQRKAGRGRKAK